MTLLRACLVSLILSGACTPRAPELASASTVTQPVLSASPELLMPGASFGRSVGDQGPPSAATSGGQALLAWTDNRLDPDSPRATAVYGARFDSVGGLLDPAGLRIGRALGSSGILNVTVAAAPDRYLVAWSDQTGTNTVHGQRVLLDGGLEGGLIRLSLANVSGGPAASFDGTDFIVAFYESGQPRVQAVRVNPANGFVVSRAFFASTPALPQVAAVAVESLPSVSFVAGRWEADAGATTNTTTARLLDGGFVSGPVWLEPMGDARVGAGSAFGVFLLAWMRPTGFGPVLEAARVTSQGVLLDAMPLTLAAANGFEKELGAISEIGGQFSVSWNEGVTPDREIRTIDVSENLAQVGATMTHATSPLIFGAPAHTAVLGRRLVAWDQAVAIGVSENDDVFARFEPSPSVLVSGALSAQLDPRVVVIGGQAYVMYETFGSVRDELRLQVVQLAGGGVAAQTSPVPSAQRNVEVALAAGAAGVGLAVFQRGNDVAGIRFGDGGLIDVAAFPIESASGTQSSATVGFDGTRWVAGWIDETLSQAVVRGVSSTGVVGAPSTLPFMMASNLAESGGPGQVLFGTSSNGRLAFSRVFADGGVSAPLTAFAGGEDWERLALAYDGVNYLSAFVSNLPDGGQSVRATRLNPGTLALIDSPPIVLQRGPVGAVATVFDGVHFVVAWVEIAGTTRTVVVNTIDGTGQVLQLAATPLLSSPFVRRIGLSSEGHGVTAAVVNRFDDTPSIQAWRVGLFALQESLAPGTPCGICPTGLFCVDGVCCNQPCGGGASNDCLVCSRAAGATVDGQCEVRRSGQVCRAGNGVCDPTESCDGVQSQCPPDTIALDQSMCPGGVCVSGRCEPDGGTAGGSAGGGGPGGGAAGGSIAGGAAGGSMAGGSGGGPVGGGSTAGGSTAGGSTAGGSAGGGSAGGGSTAGGSAGGSSAGGTAGGDADGGSGARSYAVGCGAATLDTSIIATALALLRLRRSIARKRSVTAGQSPTARSR